MIANNFQTKIAQKVGAIEKVITQLSGFYTNNGCC